MFQIGCLFNQTPFFPCVIGEHLSPQWYLASAPRGDMSILFGHRSTMVTLC